MSYIYALVDPRTNEIRYIGQTIKKPKHRLSEHITESKRYNSTHKQKWIMSLLKIGLKPSVVILEETTLELLNEREIYHIQNHTNLTNGTHGGDGGTDYWSQESIENLRLINKLKWADPEYKEKMRNKMKGIKKSDTSNFVDRQNKLWANPEYKEKMRKAQKTSKKVKVDGVTYDSISDACRVLGIKYKTTLIKRVNSKNFKNYEWG